MTRSLALGAWPVTLILTLIAAPAAAQAPAKEAEASSLDFPSVDECLKRIRSGDKEAKREGHAQFTQFLKNLGEALTESLDDDPALRGLEEALATALRSSASGLVITLGSKDSKTREKAERALRSLGPYALEALVEGLTRGKPGPRRRSARILGEIGEQAASTGPALLAALADADPRVREASATSLGRIGGRPAPGEAEALTAALRDADPGVRRAAAQALGRRGQRVADTLRLLERSVTSDPSAEARRAAAEALRQLRAGGK